MLVKFLTVLAIAAHTSNCIDITNNGYSNVVVAISENIPQPDDGGVQMISSIRGLLTETSKALFKATRYRAYLADIQILLPATWTKPVSGAETVPSNSVEPTAFKVVSTGTAGQGELPFTFHSGKCGVAGDHVEVPQSYWTTSDAAVKSVKAKALVQEWAKFRYGVFEEHGYPSDKILPYFYLHPNGYHAVTTCNSTELSGTLLEITTGAYCEAKNGLLTDPDNCRFNPYLTNQATTTSIMAFHEIDSVDSFCDSTNHQKLSPNRQNILCGSKSVWEVISSSKDFANNNNPPAQPSLNTAPTFRVLKLSPKLPAIYVVVDVSYPTAVTGNNLRTVRTALRSLVATLDENLRIGFATYKGADTGSGRYLAELLAPALIKDNRPLINSTIDLITTASPSVFVRDVGAAIRDSALKLNSYGFHKTGGAILYLVAWTRTSSATAVMELEMAQRYLSSNIKLVAAETGGADLGVSLDRFSSSVDGIHVYMEQFADATFTAINQEIVRLSRAPITLQRGLILNQELTLPISGNTNHQGSVQVYESYGDVTLSLQSPSRGQFSVTLRNSNGEEYTYDSRDDHTNWNITGSSPLVTSYSIGRLPGTWSYSVSYSCERDCSTPAVGIVQITAVLENVGLIPQVRLWTTTTKPGIIDQSLVPLIVHAEVTTSAGRVGDLSVTAEFLQKSNSKTYRLPLADGKTDIDISKDGIYSGIFYPPSTGTYEISLYVSSLNSARNNGKLLIVEDQGVICCGTESKSLVSVSNFQTTLSSALTLDVSATQTAVAKPSKIIDLAVSEEVVSHDELTVTLSWTAPADPLSPTNNKGTVSSYEIKFAQSFNELLNNFDMARYVEGSAVPAEPGTKQTVSVLVPYSGGNVYFAVRSVGVSDAKSDVSQIVWSTPNPLVETTTPAATTSPTTETSTALTTESTTIVTTSSTSTATSTTTASTTSSEDTTPSSTSTATSSSVVTTVTVDPTSTSSPSTATSTPTSIQSTTVTDITSTSTISSSISTASSPTTIVSDSTSTSTASSPITSTVTSPVTSTTSSTTVTTSPSSTGSTTTTSSTGSSVSSSTTQGPTGTTTDISSSTISSSSTTDEEKTTTSPSTTTSTVPSSSTTESPTSSTGSSSTTISSPNTTPTQGSETTTTPATTQDPGPAPTEQPFYTTPGFIGGVAAGATVLVVAVGVAIYCVCKRKRSRNEPSYYSNNLNVPSRAESVIRPHDKPLSTETKPAEKKTIPSQPAAPLKEVTVVKPSSPAVKDTSFKTENEAVKQEVNGNFNAAFEDDDGLLMTEL